SSLGGQGEPAGPSASVQKCWDRQLIMKVKDDLMAEAVDDFSRARLLAASAPHSGAWLDVPPISAIGLRMNNETIYKDCCGSASWLLFVFTSCLLMWSPGGRQRYPWFVMPPQCRSSSASLAGERYHLPRTRQSWCIGT